MTMAGNRPEHAFIDTNVLLTAQIHDANVVATMLEHELVSLVTANPRHFARFGELLDIHDLLRLA